MLLRSVDSRKGAAPAPPSNLYALSLNANGRAVASASASRVFSAYTVEFWAKHTNAARSLDGGVALGDIFSGGSTNYVFSVDFHAGKARGYGKFYSSGAAGASQDVFAYTNDGEPLSANQWTHYALSYTGSVLSFYVDAALHHAAATSLTPLSGASRKLNIGAWENGSYGLVGQIDEVRVWTVGKTQAEIAAAKDGALTGNEPNLLDYFTFDETSGAALNLAQLGNATLSGSASRVGDTPF